MKIAANSAQIPVHIGCVAHTLNLAAGKAVDLKEVYQPLSKIRSIVGYLHRSTTAAAIFAKKQAMLQLPVHKLIIDVKTRWNSSYLMVERFLEQQVAVLATLSDESIRRQHEAKAMQAGHILNPQELQDCELFLKLMEPLYHATLAMSPDQKPTVGLVLPLLKKLKTFFSEKEDDSMFEKKVKKAISDNLSKRYNDEHLVNYLEEATALDPRVKHNTPDDVWERVCEKAVDLPVPLEAFQIKAEPSSAIPHLPVLPETETVQKPSEAAQEPSDEKPPPAKKSALSYLFEDDDDLQIRKVEPAPPRIDIVKKEIRAYREHERLKMTEDPLLFWKVNRSQYPSMFCLAKQYLCAQATSVASERIFSTAGDIVSATRSCLDADHVDRLIFLKKNYDCDKDMDRILSMM